MYVCICIQMQNSNPSNGRSVITHERVFSNIFFLEKCLKTPLYERQSTG